MIRNNRVFVSLNVAGACLSLAAAALWATDGKSNGFIPVWANVTIYVLLAGGFVYQIVRRLRYGVPSIGGLSDRQLWIARGALLIGTAVVLIAFMWHRLHL